jgi:hypothetical protein
MPANRSALPSSPGFQRRYDALEHRRAELLARLANFDANAHGALSYRRALTLLNTTFRKASLAQRESVLRAAAWLIDVLERLALRA